MYSYDFPVPYPEMVLFTFLCMICICIGGWIIKKYWVGFPPYLIPLVLVIMSFIISNIYFDGLRALFTFDIYDLRAIANGLTAIGFHQLVTKTYKHFKYRKLKGQKPDRPKIP